MKFFTVAAAALGLASSVLALPAPECKTPAVFVVTTLLSPLHTIYEKVTGETTAIPCGPGCKLDIQTKTITHSHWKGEVTATVYHKEHVTPIPICALVLDVPPPKEEEGKKEDD
ncbi:hypothetical protein TWF281_005315 [Arthrobotrys megalospora]